MESAIALVFPLGVVRIDGGATVVWRMSSLHMRSVIAAAAGSFFLAEGR